MYILNKIHEFVVTTKCEAVWLKQRHYYFWFMICKNRTNRCSSSDTTLLWSAISFLIFNSSVYTNIIFLRINIFLQKFLLERLSRDICKHCSRRHCQVIASLHSLNCVTFTCGGGGWRRSMIPRDCGSRYRSIWKISMNVGRATHSSRSSVDFLCIKIRSPRVFSSLSSVSSFQFRDTPYP